MPDSDRGRWFKPSSWSLATSVWVAIVAAITSVVILVELLGWLAYRTWRPWTQAHRVQVTDLVKLSLTLVAGAAATQGLVVAYRRQRSNERDEAGRRDDVRLMTERFGAASSQLGSQEAATRLAGVYAMATVADEWTAQRQQCVDVLCAYLRLPYRPREEQSDFYDTERMQYEPDWRRRGGEREVRRTVLRTIREHLLPDSTSNWQGCTFDLNGAVLDGGSLTEILVGQNTVLDFTDAVLVGPEFTFFRSTVNGIIRLDRAVVEAKALSFAHCTFDSDATVSFVGTSLNETKVTFSDSVFAGKALIFIEAVFRNSTLIFTRMELNSGLISLTGVQAVASNFVFSKSRLKGGEVRMRRGIVTSGSINFGQAQFIGATVNMSTKFENVAVTFNRATVIGGSISLEGSEFIGRRPSRDGASFEGWTALSDA